MARITIDGAGCPRYTFTLCKAENSGRKARCLFVYKTRKGSSDTKYIFQFGRILAFCFLGEVLHVVLPLPVPASVYGLVLLLAALTAGVVKLEQVKETGTYLTGIFPLLFVPAAAGIMELVGRDGTAAAAHPDRHSAGDGAGDGGGRPHHAGADRPQ